MKKVLKCVIGIDFYLRLSDITTRTKTKHKTAEGIMERIALKVTSYFPPSVVRVRKTDRIFRFGGGGPPSEGGLGSDCLDCFGAGASRPLSVDTSTAPSSFCASSPESSSNMFLRFCPNALPGFGPGFLLARLRPVENCGAMMEGGGSVAQVTGAFLKGFQLRDRWIENGTVR